MNLHLNRFISAPNYTMGALHIDGVFQSFTLEDEERHVKVPGETRIPDGVYNIKLRTVGGTHERYLKRFGPDFHRGMLWLQDVPNFQHILIHIGNTEADTDGCILVGKNATSSGAIAESGRAYKELYPLVAKSLLLGEQVTITITSTHP